MLMASKEDTGLLVTFLNTPYTPVNCVAKRFVDKSRDGFTVCPSGVSINTENGVTVWKLHRVDGPAVYELNNEHYYEWFLNGRRHRVGGPALVQDDGNDVWTEEWFIHGVRHREDGPAIVIHKNETGLVVATLWYMGGKQVCGRDYDSKGFKRRWKKLLREYQVTEIMGL
jgi:hypothetical protein